MRFMLVRAAVALALLGAPACWAKTPQDCADEYVANKDKIDGVQTRAQFQAACEAGQEVVSGPTSAAIPAVPASTAAGQPATPASAAVKPGAP